MGKGTDTVAAVGYRGNDYTQLVHQIFSQKRSIDDPAARQHQFVDAKQSMQFLQKQSAVQSFLAGKQIETP